MKIKNNYPPYQGAKLNDISQGFGINPMPYQPNGHTGVDFAPQNGYGKILVAPENVYIDAVITPDKITGNNDDLDHGFGVRMKSQIEPNLYYLFWHCLPIFPVKQGEYVQGGQPVAQMGNSGFVMMRGKLVPLDERVKTKWGTHVHYEEYYLENGEPRFIDCVPNINFTKIIKFDFITTMQKILRTMLNVVMNRY